MGKQFDPVILGHGQIYSGDCAQTQLNRNELIVGASGAGKSMSFLEPAMLNTEHSSLMITLAKRDLVEKYTLWFREKGYQVWDLNLVRPEKSTVAYDPLQFVQSYTDIKNLAMSVVLADPQKSRSSADPYWDKGGSSLLCALISYVMMTKRDATFADVLELLDQLEIDDRGSVISTSLDEKFERVKRSDPNSFAVTNWRTFHQLPIKTASCIFSALNTTVDEMFSPELRRMMRMKTTLDLESLATRRTVLFVTTSAVNTASHRFANLFYAQAFQKLFEFAEDQPDGRLPLPVQIKCDDFAVGSKIHNFPEFISILRAKNMSVQLMLQSESQLERMYGSADATTIINNCDTYVYLGGMDLATCRNVSHRLNMPLEDVLYMPIGQEFIFRRGQKPVVTERYHTLEDPAYQHLEELLRRRGQRSRRRECA